MHNLNKLGRGLLVDATHKDQDTVVADKNIFSCFPYLLLYLRNKETQQTLQVIVCIQYDASF